MLVHQTTGTTQGRKRPKKRKLLNGQSQKPQQQQGKMLICNQGVVGSNPTAGTNEFNDLVFFYLSIQRIICGSFSVSRPATTA